MENLIEYIGQLKSNKDIIKLLESENKHCEKLEYFDYNDFNKLPSEIDNYLSQLTDKIYNILPKSADIQGIYFLLYEILINVYKHSKFKNSYFQWNINNTNNTIEFYIFDDGIGIPGSFKEAFFNYKNDCDVIFDAINGKTTDKEKYKLHGRGLNSSVQITTLGFNGEMLIISGKCACLITVKGAKTFNNDTHINGTFIIMKINNKKIDNIYNYLKYEKINKITEVKYD